MKGGIQKRSKNSKKHNPVISASKLANQEVVLTLILERLPIKKIAAFRCISKGVKSIIDKRVFNPVCLKPRGLILSYDQREKLYIPLSSVHQAPSMSWLEYHVILQECNGLLLCNNVVDWESTSKPRLCVINTSTGTTKFPPSANISREGNADTRSNRIKLQGYTKEMSTSLSFDPLVCAPFQLISIWSHTDNLNSKYRIELYTSQNETWKLCYRLSVKLHELAITPNNNILEKSGVYWNGSINWCNTDGGLVYYNIDKRRLSSVQPPQAHNQNHRNNYFNQCRGLLILIRISAPTGSFDVFDMSVDHSAWKFKYTIDLHLMTPGHGFPGSSFNVLLAEIEDRELVYVVAQGNRVFKIHHEKKVFKDLGVQLERNGNFDAFKYIDTIPDCCFQD